MKILLTLFCFVSFCFCVQISDIQAWYKNEQFERVCSSETKEFMLEIQNDEVTNLYAKSCLALDKINELIFPIVLLYKNSFARENAAYYSTILYQKKLLYMALNDKIDISYVVLPKVDYVLSNIFEKFVKKDYKLNNGKYIFESENMRYELFSSIENGISKMFLLTYKNDKINSIKTYW